MNGFMPMKITGVTQRFLIILDLLDEKHKTDMTGFICHSIIHAGETVAKVG
ncbi:MAG: hypothetical protein NTU62_03765 [Spirochaetes bacterium]|nr:hypothetical protein [Spirochaetota bacterium]